MVDEVDTDGWMIDREPLMNIDPDHRLIVVYLYNGVLKSFRCPDVRDQKKNMVCEEEYGHCY